jgi:hypothetical protein
MLFSRGAGFYEDYTLIHAKSRITAVLLYFVKSPQPFRLTTKFVCATYLYYVSDIRLFTVLELRSECYFKILKVEATYI